MNLADSHVHFFPGGYASGYGPFFPAGGEIVMYRQMRRVHAISDVLAVGYEGPGYDGNNRYLATLASRQHWIHPVAYASPFYPPTPERLSRWWRQRFVGLSIYVNSAAEAQALALWPQESLDALNARRAVISINIGVVDLPHAVPFLETLGACTILISHLGLPPVEVTAEGLESALAPLVALARHSHIGVKASAFYAIGTAHEYPHPRAVEAFELLLAAFGPQRLYWGSDFVPALEFVSFAQTVAMLDRLGLGEEEKRAIGGENLRRLFV